MTSIVIDLKIPAALLLVRMAANLRYGWCFYDNDMSGRIVLITGASSGIGKRLAIDMAKRSATVVLACRWNHNVDEILDEIYSRVPYAALDTMYLDLSDLSNVREFVGKLCEKYDKLDVIVNNAATALHTACSPPLSDQLNREQCSRITQLDPHFRVNYLGHFLLTGLLMQKLKHHDTHIVVTGSSAYKQDSSDLDIAALCDDFSGTPSSPTIAMSPVALHARSKLCNLLFVQTLSERLSRCEHLRGVTVNLVTPGWFYSAWSTYLNSTFKRAILLPFTLLFTRSITQAIQTHLTCIMHPNRTAYNGYIFSNCAPQKHASCISTNSSLRQRLWTLSEQLTKFKFSI